MDEISVKDVMTIRVVTVTPEDSIHEAALRLAGNRISGMPVVAGRLVIGVVSESDLIQAMTPLEDRDRGMTVLDYVMAHREPRTRPEPTRVEHVMSRLVATISPHARVWEAAAEMHQRGVKRLPVTDDDGRLVGIISRADLVRAIAQDGARLAKGAEGPGPSA
ncbi:MAG TPA: CBS domain-containing protein [Actinomycetota bacterium]|nr:CBS domain-containing protein [Actinomycetota bacterium]